MMAVTTAAATAAAPLDKAIPFSGDRNPSPVPSLPLRTSTPVTTTMTTTSSSDKEKTMAYALEQLGAGKDLANSANILKQAIEAKSEASVALLTQGGVKHVVRALEHCADAVSALACVNLAVEVAQIKLQGELVDEGAGLALCKLLRTFSGDARLCESGCKLVRVSSDESRLKSALFVQGCGKACIAALQRHCNDVPLARQALWAMHSLAWCETNKAALMQHGAGAAVLQAMRSHVDVHVQHQGCCVVASLAFAIENRAPLSDLGAGPTVLAAIKAFPKDVDVVKNGAAALVGLTFEAASKSPMFNAGAAPVVLSALATHNTNPKVAQHCCLVIANLACEPSLRAPLLDMGALALVKAASRLAPKESRNASYKLGGSRN